MDDIARELGISKKTVYEKFGSKEDLIYKVISHHLERAQKLIEQAEDQSENAIECWLAIANDHIKMQREFHSSILFDLQKYYPKGWAIFKEHINGFLMGHIVRKIRRGMEEGLFRKNLIPEVVAFHQLAKLDAYSDPSIFKKLGYDITTVYNEIIKMQLYAIVSDRGRKYLNKKYSYED